MRDYNIYVPGLIIKNNDFENPLLIRGKILKDMDTSKGKKDQILVILEKSNDGYWASVEELPGCYSFGDTLEVALNNVREAIDEHISDVKETGEEVPEVFSKSYTIQVKYDLQTLFEKFHFINKTAFAEIAGINPSLLRQYAKGIAFPGEKQKAKIKKALREIGQSLENVCL